MKILLKSLFVTVISASGINSLVACDPNSNKDNGNIPNPNAGYEYKDELTNLTMAFLINHNKIKIQDEKNVQIIHTWFNDGRINLLNNQPTQTVDQVKIYNSTLMNAGYKSQQFVNDTDQQKDFPAQGLKNVPVYSWLKVPNWYGINTPIDFLVDKTRSDIVVALNSHFKSENSNQSNFWTVDNTVNQKDFTVSVKPKTRETFNINITFRSYQVGANLLFKIASNNLVNVTYRLNNQTYFVQYLMSELYSQINQYQNYKDYFTNSNSFIYGYNNQLVASVPVLMQLYDATSLYIELSSNESNLKQHIK